MNLYLRLLGHYGSVASLIGLVLTQAENKLTAGHWILVVLSTAFLILATILEIREYISRRPHSFRHKSQIDQYLHDWIHRGGRVAIFTRDMTWARSQKIREMLFRKCEKHELCICAPEVKGIVAELKAKGADVYDYSGIDFVPRARFTIVNRGRDDAKVAVGSDVGGRFLITEYRNGEHPFFAVAQDFVEFLEAYNKVKAHARHPA